MNKYQFFIIPIILNFIFISSSEQEACLQQKPELNSYKCYYENTKNGADFICKDIPSSVYSSDIKYEYINNTLYSIICNCTSPDKNKTYPLEQCGDSKSKDNLDDCKKHSTVLNSCCFTERNEIYAKGCNWLGTKYEGDIDWAGGHFECNSDYLNAKYLFIIFLIFTFIF